MSDYLKPVAGPKLCPRIRFTDKWIDGRIVTLSDGQCNKVLKPRAGGGLVCPVHALIREATP